jgi:hypothetical protein
MRIKFDFVTNSSSTAYILALHPDSLDSIEEFVAKLGEDNPDTNEGIGTDKEYRTLIELQEYVNNGPFDWVSKCRGLQYENMSEANYKVCKAAIEDGLMVMFVYVDHDLTDEFEDGIRDVAEIIDSDG